MTTAPKTKKGRRARGSWPSQIELELDVDGVHPSNVNALAFLEYATAYLQALRLAARLQDGELEFSGIKIVDKCVALRSSLNNADLGWTSATQVDSYVAGTVDPPRKNGLLSQTRAVTASHERLLATLPSAKRQEARTVVRIDDRRLTLRPPPSPEKVTVRYRSIETLRARVERLAGADERLKVRLEPIIGAPFVAEMTEEQALEVRHHWLDEVDVDVEVERALGGAIIKGRLLKFHQLVDGGVDEWRSWVEAGGGGNGGR